MTPLQTGIVIAVASSVTTVLAQFLIRKLWKRLFRSPIPIEKSADELVAWYKSFPNDYQANRAFTRAYKGLFFRHVGIIDSIQGGFGKSAYFWIGPVGGSIRSKKADRFTEGETAEIIGTLSTLGPDHVQLGKCQIRHIQSKSKTIGAET